MADSATQQGVLGLKALAAQRAFEARGMSAGKALRRALSRSADVLWDLALVAQTVDIEMLDQDGVVDALQAGDLLVVLDGPDAALGLACIDREVLTALVEVQTIQQVTQMPVDDRSLTHTDAAMTAPFLDDVLGRFASNLEDNPMRATLEGYRFGAMIEDARAAAHLLAAPGYNAFSAKVDLALGRRKGRIAFFLPLEAAASDGSIEFRPGRHEQVMKRLPVFLEAALARIRLPLHAAEDLKTGDLLPLPPDVVDGLELRAGQDTVVARGRLGQMNGMRAIRLSWPVVASGQSADNHDDRSSVIAEKDAELDEVALNATVVSMPDVPRDLQVADPLAEDVPGRPAAPALEFGEDFETMSFDALDFDAQVVETD